MAKIIYAIEIIHNFDIVANLIAGGLAVFFGIPALMCFIDGCLAEFLEQIRPHRKLLIFLTVVTTTFMMIIPSKETMYAMLITEKVLTKENYNLTIQETERLIDYTISSIEKLKEKKGD